MDAMQEKFDAFKDNYLRIEEHNAYVDPESGESAPFTMAINKFSDMTEAEFVQERLSTKLPIKKAEKRLQM